ncbi:MAG: class IV adenylate cyclase [Mariniblastus sp.]|nr:class IV adenylate cyclase [Mariniblastus sp.]
MAKNVEIKARIPVLGFSDLKERVSVLADGESEILNQVDSFFHSRKGRLKLREFADGKAELLYYERQNLLGPKTSFYTRIEIESVFEMKALLTASNGLLGVVAKKRELFFIGRTRVHLDEVEQLGTFLELEVVLTESETSKAGMAIADELMSSLQIETDQLVSNSYFDLLSGI